MKKYLPYIIVAVIVVIVIIVLSNKSSNLTPTNNIGLNNKIIIIDKGDKIPEKICSEIKNQVIVIWKTGCPGCSVAIPILQEIEKEQNLNFNYINVAEEQGRRELLRIGLVPRWVPTVLVNCAIYVGPLKKEEYEQIIKEEIK